MKKFKIQNRIIFHLTPSPYADIVILKSVQLFLPTLNCFDCDHEMVWAEMHFIHKANAMTIGFLDLIICRYSTPSHDLMAVT